MVRLFVVLGLALLAGGAYAIVDGWPYRVLERGFTEVILGALAVAVGLILLALAPVLAEIRRLKGMVSGAMAAVALSESRSDPRAASTEAPVRAEPTLDSGPAASETGHVGITTTLAAGAGAAAVAGGLTELAKDGEEPQAKVADETEEADRAVAGDDARPEDGAAEPSQAPSDAAGENEDWLLPPVSPVLDASPSDVHPGERGESGGADEKAETSEGDEDRPGPAGVDAVSYPDREPGDETEPGAVPLDEPAAAQPEEEKDAPKETAPMSPSGDRLWWPRIDRPAREKTASLDDDFNALRDQLTGAVNTPEVEPPRRDRDALDMAESWMTPRPWPPITQPRDPVDLSEVEPEPAGKAPTEDAMEELSGKAEPSASATEEEGEPLPPTEADAAGEDEPSTAEAKPDVEPAASEEGVIGAYQVGETQFTMFADGSIHARTPDGDYTFASMDELKAYLASEKSRLEP